MGGRNPVDLSSILQFVGGTGMEGLPEGRRKVRILLAGLGSLFREAVRVVLEMEPDLVVVAETDTGVEAVAGAERSRAHLALLQSEPSADETIRAAGLIRKRLPQCKVAIIADQADQAAVIRALDAGATGFLTMESRLEGLIEAVRSIDRGEIVVPPQIVSGLIAKLIERRHGRREALRRVVLLTKRERQVLVLLANGVNNETIAQLLMVSPQTARTHVQNLLGKLDVHSRLEAAAFVTQNGLLDELVLA
jgi:two-component system, NarL family, response regulator DegU